MLCYVQIRNEGLRLRQRKQPGRRFSHAIDAGACCAPAASHFKLGCTFTQQGRGFRDARSARRRWPRHASVVHSHRAHVVKPGGVRRVLGLRGSVQVLVLFALLLLLLLLQGVLVCTRRVNGVHVGVLRVPGHRMFTRPRLLKRRVWLLLLLLFEEVPVVAWGAVVQGRVVVHVRRRRRRAEVRAVKERLLVVMGLLVVIAVHAGMVQLVHRTRRAGGGHVPVMERWVGVRRGQGWLREGVWNGDVRRGGWGRNLLLLKRRGSSLLKKRR
mmetsp:Transcript_31067/g.62132  ORF Transcript_31067/g.62132 Transcript_31067/m.62132 type:complete len:270 (+) Transcript_31067:189-998(+)